MREERKLGSLVALAALFCVLGIAYNVASEYFLTDIQEYFKRKVYYETVISKKGLSMHRAMYWRTVDGNEGESGAGDVTRE